MYLLKRPNGFYYVVYCIDGKKQYQTTKTKLKNQATEYLRKFSPKKIINIQTSIKLSSFIQKYLEHTKAIHSEKTYKNESVPFKLLLNIIQDKFLHEITSRDIDYFIGRKISEGTKAVTVNSYLGTIRGMFSKAVKWGFIEMNPVASKKLKSPEILPIFFGKEEFSKFLNAIDDMDVKELMLFGLFSGMRLSEITNLRWCDVDLDRKIILIQNSEIFRTKSGRSRNVPMNDDLYKILFLKSKGAIGEFVFSRNGKPYRDEYVSKTFKKHVRRAGLNERLHFHSLRHTFASWLVQQGTGLYEVQKLLGHQDIKTSMIYAHLQPETLHNTVNKLSL